MPLNTSLVAMVTTRGKSRSFAAMTPLSRPIAKPSAMQTGQTMKKGRPVWVMMMPATQPHTAIWLPTDRSMPPLIMTKQMPMPAMMM